MFESENRGGRHMFELKPESFIHENIETDW